MNAYVCGKFRSLNFPVESICSRNAMAWHDVCDDDDDDADADDDGVVRRNLMHRLSI